MSQIKEFDQFRRIYLSNLVNREYPTLPAYYFYLNHTTNKNVLSQNQFERLFLKAVNEYFHPITQEYASAEMDLEQIYQILDGYYNIQYLLDSDGKLIQMV